MISISAAGCFTDLPADGALKCAAPPGPACPDGFRCAGDGTCWRLGRAPDLTALEGADLAGTVDDLALADLTGADLTGGPDGGGGGSDGGMCVGVALTAATRPLDLVVLVDTSGSMTDEFAAVEALLTSYLPAVLPAFDSRVVLLGKFGTSAITVCMPPPIGANTCTNEPKPVQTGSFYHYDVLLDSNDVFAKTTMTLTQPDPGCSPSPSPAPPCATGGWKDRVRSEAVLKAFLAITDDAMAMPTTAEFEAPLFATTSQFGSTSARNYIWYSLIGVNAKDSSGTPWTAAELPASTAETNHCPSGVAAGLKYQALSKTTDGLAASVCDLNHYQLFVNAMAQHADARAGCWFALPSSGTPASLELVLAGSRRALPQVNNAAACAPNGFYAAEGRLRLCAADCTDLRADVNARVERCN